jgi:phosphatidylserine/phosphatidylglycerophosphate/cardiolipin synthase-like enzyme
VVVTGSHNFSRSASEENDENFVVVRGNRRLAEAYAVACAGVWDHYGWRAHVNGELRAGRVPWSHLRPDSGWQREKATAERRRELGLWVRSP